MEDLLFNLVFEDLEVFFFQTCHKAIVSISHRRVDLYRIDVTLTEAIPVPVVCGFDEVVTF
jgi:hypothetical protein